MKTYLAALLGASMLTAPVMAADVYGGSMKDSSVAVTSTAPSWVGPYIGLSAGLGVGRSSNDMSFNADDKIFGPKFPDILFSTEDELSGAVYGGQVGYNLQAGRIVFGLEASLSGTDISGKESGAGLASFIETDTAIDWLGTVEGRLGVASGNSLFYVHGGLAVANVTTSATATLGLDNPGFSARLGETDETRYGFVVGAGVEHAIGDGWTARVHYSYIDLGEANSSTPLTIDDEPVGRFGLNSDVTINTITVGVNRKF